MMLRALVGCQVEIGGLTVNVDAGNGGCQMYGKIDERQMKGNTVA
jgi:hypothetical protein